MAQTFDDYMRRHGATPDGNPATAPIIQKDIGEGQVAGAKGANAPRREQVETVHTETGTQLTAAQTEKLRRDMVVKDTGDRAAGEAAVAAELQRRRRGSEAARGDLEALALLRELNGPWTTGAAAGLAKLPFGSHAKQMDALLEKLKNSSSVSGTRELREDSKTGAVGTRGTNTEFKALATARGNMVQGLRGEDLARAMDDYELFLRRSLAISNHEDPNAPLTAQRYQYNLSDQPAGSPVAGDAPTEQIDGTKTINNAGIPGGLAALIKGMIQGGRSAQDIRYELNKVESGLGGKTTHIEDWVDYYSKRLPNGNHHATPEVDMSGRLVDKTGLDLLRGELLDNPLGAGAAAFTTGFSGNAVPDMARNPERAKADLAGLRLKYPESSDWGNLGGTIAQYALLAGAGKLLGVGKELGPTAINGIQGGFQGFNNSKEDGWAALPDAAAQAGESMIGGKIIGAGGNAAAAMFRGANNPEAKYLADKYIPQTLGDIVGGWGKRAEGKISRMPFVGSALQRSRDEGLGASNTAALHEGLEPLANVPGVTVNPVGAVGDAGVAEAKGQVSKVYDDLLGDRTFALHPGHAAALDDIHSGLTDLGEIGKQTSNAIRGQFGNIPDTLQPISGNQAQDMLQAIPTLRNSAKNSVFSNKTLYQSTIRPHLDKYQAILEDAFGQGDPTIIRSLRHANEAWRNTSVLEDAAKLAIGRNSNRMEQAGMWHPDDLITAGRANAEAYGPPKVPPLSGYGPPNKAQPGEVMFPFKRLAQATTHVLTPPANAMGSLVLPGGAGLLAGTLSRYASGTTDPDTDHTTYQDPITTSVTGLGVGSLAALTAAAPYSAPARRMLQKMLLGQRSGTSTAIGNLIAKYVTPVARNIGVSAISDANYDPLPKRNPKSHHDIKLPESLPVSGQQALADIALATQRASAQDGVPSMDAISQYAGGQ